MNDINLAKVDLNLLKSLKVLIQEQHVGHAARKMNVTQSAMSHTLSRLRDVFNDPLFTRHAKGLEPTARTLELAPKLNIILSDIDALLMPKKLDFSQIHARFRIQTHDFIVTSYLPKLLNAINDEAPNIVIDIQILGNSAYDKLDSGKLDMLIGAGLKASPRFMQKRLINEPLVCLLDKQHPALKNWNPDTIFHYPHIKSTLVDDRDDPVNQYAKSMGLPERHIGLYAGSLSFQPALLTNTHLIAFLPKSIAVQGSQLYGLSIKSCPFPLPALRIRGMWHERHQNDPIHKWVRDKISDAFIGLD